MVMISMLSWAQTLSTSWRRSSSASSFLMALTARSESEARVTKQKLCSEDDCEITSRLNVLAGAGAERPPGDARHADHAAPGHRDQMHVGDDGDRLGDPGRALRVGLDARAGMGGVEGVAHQDRHALIHDGQDRLGMEHFGPKKASSPTSR
jgi:hypothetical protein